MKIIPPPNDPKNQRAIYFNILLILLQQSPNPDESRLCYEQLY